MRMLHDTFDSQIRERLNFHNPVQKSLRGNRRGMVLPSLIINSLRLNPSCSTYKGMRLPYVSIGASWLP